MRQLTRPLSRIVFLLSLQIAGFAQGITLSVASGSGAAGTIVSLPITLTSLNGAQVAGVQWSFQYSADITSVAVVVGPAAANAGKSLQCSVKTCLLFGLDTTTIDDGIVATASFQIAANPSTASIPVQVSGVVAVTQASDSIPATGISGTIIVLTPPPIVSVGINPLTASLTASQSQQFSAAVTGSPNTSVTWSMTPAVGSLSNGLYTAPSVINTAQSVTIAATSVADPTKSASATVQLTPIVSIGVNPLTATLTASQSQQFSAAVTGSPNTSVTWSMTPLVGTLSNGLYTAPSVINTAQSVTIAATSVADPTKSASATVQLTPIVSVGINPLTASLTASQSQQFSAAVTGSPNTSVTWSMTPSAGSLSNGLYIAPSVINTAQSVTITATSVADPTKSASATIQLTPIVSVSVGITPLTATLTASQSRQFTAAVTGSPNTSVTWSMTFHRSVGSLANGLYTAPSVIHNADSVAIIATSVADPTKSASAIIQLKPKGGTPALRVTSLSDGQLGRSKFTPNVTVPGSPQISATAGITAGIKVPSDTSPVLLSAASLKPGPMAPDSMVTVFGDQLAGTVQLATEQPLPTALGGCTINIKDVNGVERAAGLYYVSPNQINFKIPADTAEGLATITETSGDQTQTLGNLNIAAISPGLFFLNSDGLAAADLMRVNGNDTSYEEVAQLDVTTNRFVAVPVDLGSNSDEVYLTLYGTGFRHRSSLDSVQVLVANMPALVNYAGASATSEGVDLVRVLLPKELRGTGTATVVVTVNGISSNTVSLVIE